MLEPVADNPDAIQALDALAAGLGLSAAAGFRVFVPLLVLGVCQRLEVAVPLSLGEGFEWISSWPAIIMLSAATLAEVGAYYVPWIDNLLDSIATPAAMVSGTLLSAALMPEMPEAIQWAGAVVMGGGTAGVVQLGSVLTRATSTATSGGLANPIVSTGEAGGAVATSVLALVIPFVIGFFVLLLVIWLGSKIIRRLFRKRQAPAQPA